MPTRPAAGELADQFRDVEHVAVHVAGIVIAKWG
jgi:hypothetical protein